MIQTVQRNVLTRILAVTGTILVWTPTVFREEKIGVKSLFLTVKNHSSKLKIFPR
ncbi:MAG: hypothetical protein U9N08_05420 [Candidatus Caldatribacteriota bacterium]|nr:hypothetical protein [Candidatus Caldatribacteriota bacterium]